MLTTFEICFVDIVVSMNAIDTDSGAYCIGNVNNAGTPRQTIITTNVRKYSWNFVQVNKTNTEQQVLALAIGCLAIPSD